MNAVDRYLRARGLMESEGRSIPNWILRGYLDTLRVARKFNGSGLQEIVIVVDKNSSPEMLKLFTDTAFETSGVLLEVRS